MARATGRPRLYSRLLVSPMAQLQHCWHLGSQPADGKSVPQKNYRKIELKDNFGGYKIVSEIHAQIFFIIHIFHELFISKLELMIFCSPLQYNILSISLSYHQYIQTRKPQKSFFFLTLTSNQACLLSLSFLNVSSPPISFSESLHSIMLNSSWFPMQYKVQLHHESDFCQMFI